MNRLLIAFALVCLPPALLAQDDAGCGKFAWPLAIERQQLAAPDKPVLDPGAELATKPTGAFTMRLRPASQIAFPHPPERKREGSAGYATIGALGGAGLYQITISQDAWLDVIQNGEFARSAGSSGRRDCPGLRKSVRFHLQPAPVLIQVSGGEGDEIAVVITKVE